MLICATCAVERDEPTPELCPICTDERQYVPDDGQKCISLEELAQAGQQLLLEENEPGLIGIRTAPKVGIGQTTQLVVTPQGSLLWDPVGFVDDISVKGILERGPVVAIAASHPHMFGVQVEWSRRLGGVPVLVADADPTPSRSRRPKAASPTSSAAPGSPVSSGRSGSWSSCTLSW